MFCEGNDMFIRISVQAGIGNGVRRARNFDEDYLDSALRARPMSRPFRVIVISASIPCPHPPQAVSARRRYIEIPHSHLMSNAGGLRFCNIAGNSAINSTDKSHRHSIRLLFLLYVCKETRPSCIPRVTYPLSRNDDSVLLCTWLLQVDNVLNSDCCSYGSFNIWRISRDANEPVFAKALLKFPTKFQSRIEQIKREFIMTLSASV